MAPGPDDDEDEAMKVLFFSLWRERRIDIDAAQDRACYLRAQGQSRSWRERDAKKNCDEGRLLNKPHPTPFSCLRRKIRLALPTAVSYKKVR